MATSAEQTFYVAVAKAAGTKQTSYASALATYGFVQANLAAYQAAIIAADVAFVTAINSAASTAAITPNVVPDYQGVFGPSPWATIAT